MPLTTLASYIPTMDEFLTHWQLVDDDTGLTLQGGFEMADFEGLRDDLQATMTTVVGAVNIVSTQAANRDQLRVALRERIRQFRAQVQALLSDSVYARAVPKLPQEAAGEGIYLEALDDVANLWTRINADASIPGFGPPLTLAGGYTLATFNTDVTALRAAYRGWRDAEKTLEVERDTRDAALPVIRERMRQYQAGVEGVLPAGHVLLESVPRMSPAAGSTPDPVTLSGSWDGAAIAAELSWTESADDDLANYAVRMTPGPTYDTANDVHVATVAPGSSTFSTDNGLANEGDTASFKVYVILTTGNEAGSNTLTITREAGP